MFELQKHKTTCIHIQKHQQKKTEQEKKNKPIIYANNKFFKYE